MSWSLPKLHTTTACGHSQAALCVRVASTWSDSGGGMIREIEDGGRD